jgi:hypothetical protein
VSYLNNFIILIAHLDEETDNIPAAEDEEDEEEMLLASLTTTEAPTTAMKRRRLKPVRLTPKSLSTTTQLPYDIIEEEEANFRLEICHIGYNYYVIVPKTSTLGSH